MKYNKKQEYDRELTSHADVALIQPRDQESWTKDPLLKDFKSKFDGSSGRGTNYLIESYIKEYPYLRANIKLTVGKQRL